VGPFSSIGPDCVIEESEVEHSVLLAGAKLLGVARVDDSLIGREVVVRRRERLPQVYRFMLGDHSEAVVP
jgi:glucose-1-phosphate thymidylyltransferase